MPRPTPLPFSPHYDFVWTRAGRLNGVPYAKDDPVDVTQLDVRRLQALFDLRHIKPVQGFNGPPPAYLANGEGLADKLQAEREAAEATLRERAEKAEARADLAEKRLAEVEAVPPPEGEGSVTEAVAARGKRKANGAVQAA